MKKILAVILATMMLVSCFAFSTTAAEPYLFTNSETSDGHTRELRIWAENVVAGETMDLVCQLTFTDTVADRDGNTFDYYFVYQSSQLEFVGLEVVEGINGDDSLVGYGADATDYEYGDMYAFASTTYGALSIGDGATEQNITIKFKFNVLAEAGETITLVDDYSSPFVAGGFCYITPFDLQGSEDQRFNFVVESAAAAVDAPVAEGAQIKTTEPQGLRFGFTLDKTAESYANITEKGVILAITSDLAGAELTVDNATVAVEVAKYLTTDASSETFTACVTDIPESAYDTAISARAYIVVDGTTYYSDVIDTTVNTIQNAIA